MIKQEEDTCFSIKGDIYKIAQPKDIMLLKKIFIKKKSLVYSFIGGMWYSKDKFSLENNISLPYPFTTYYTVKILDKHHKGNICKSLIYVKMPILILQFINECISIEFDPIIKINNTEVFPFISLDEDNENYIISFYVFQKFLIKEKKNAWLGFGKKRVINLNIKQNNTFKFSIKIKKYNDWTDAVKSCFMKELPNSIKIQKSNNIFKQAQKALWRSYDHISGSFLQLPWRNTTDFTFINSSYSLLSYEAVRLHYFTKWFQKSKDIQFLKWSKELRNLFINPNLYLPPSKIGEGIIWYNMTNLNRHGLQGFFYMDCGYSGYPGGQATIAFHLLKYLENVDDEKIENIVIKSLDYLISTQKENGAWPMAIHQEGYIRLRNENLELYETHGGTGECARALISGYKKFNDNKMKTIALDALNYLETNTPICYNGLRDIGIQEPEAFSAINIIDAYIDAFEITNDKKYLKNAQIYAFYTIPWFYLYNTEKLSIKFNFHPISFSITPRLSPYENIWIFSTYLRLYKITGSKFWKQLAYVCYNEGIKWITKNGGLCEGIFPNYLSDLRRLPMEQTFATVELMNAASHFNNNIVNKANKNRKSDIVFNFQRDCDLLNIYCKNELFFVFDFKKLKVEYIKGVELNEYGISFSFFNPYSFKSKIVSGVKKYIRGRVGKFILGSFDIKYFLRGVYRNEKSYTPNIYPFEKIKKKEVTFNIEKDFVYGYCKTNLHKIELKITVKKIGKKIHIFFDPLIINTLKHDLSCDQVLFPIIGKKLKNKNSEKLNFDGLSIKGEIKSIFKTDDFTAVNQTLSTNWTHGGIFKGQFEIIIESSLN